MQAVFDMLRLYDIKYNFELIIANNTVRQKGVMKRNLCSQEIYGDVTQRLAYFDNQKTYTMKAPLPRNAKTVSATIIVLTKPPVAVRETGISRLS